jgi:ribosomal-protein-alanine N-acetyltransferase
MRIDSPPILDLPGIALRPLERIDLDAWYAYLSVPAVVEHTSWDLKSIDDLAAVYAFYELDSPQSARRLAIVDASTDALIGTIGFHTVSTVNRTAELAYDLAPAYWGRGIATAVCDAVTQWSYGAYGFLRVQATVLESNARSARVLERCRFAYEGSLRAYRLVRGTPGTFRMYSRLATD